MRTPAGEAVHPRSPRCLNPALTSMPLFPKRVRRVLTLFLWLALLAFLGWHLRRDGGGRRTAPRFAVGAPASHPHRP
jgi:hypothetical protein